jgi:hypothetical protein
MRTVWKCDFCHKTNDDSNYMADHEEECSYNPKNKLCWTCYHAKDNPNQYPFGGTLFLCLNKKVESDYMHDVIEENKPCNYWETKQ